MAKDPRMEEGGKGLMWVFGKNETLGFPEGWRGEVQMRRGFSIVMMIPMLS